MIGVVVYVDFVVVVITETQWYHSGGFDEHILITNRYNLISKKKLCHKTTITTTTTATAITTITTAPTTTTSMGCYTIEINLVRL